MIHAWMKASPLQSTLFLPHHLLPTRLGNQNPSSTLNPGKSLQISETPTWVLDYASQLWKNPSLQCKHILWWSSNAILMISQTWKTNSLPLPPMSINSKNNYFSTKPLCRHHALPTYHPHHSRPGPTKLPEQPQANPLPPSKTKSLPLLFSPNATAPLSLREMAPPYLIQPTPSLY